MRLREFFKFVEIRTKLCSVMPLIIALCYSMWNYGKINIELSIVFFISMICIDMATTGLNNYMDYKKAILKDGYNYKEHNAMVAFSLDERVAKNTIIILYVIAFVFGMYLVYRTDLSIFLIGVLGVVIGILYSAGPIAISHTPYGEIFSGITMGLFIFFVGVYIQIDYLSQFSFVSNSSNLIGIPTGNIEISFNMRELFVPVKLFLLSIPIILPISNIMLANNMCTIDDDVANKRYTLPYFIGVKKSVIIFRYLYYIMVFLMVIYSAIGLLPKTVAIGAIIFILIPSTRKKIQEFSILQDKKHTFVYSVQLFLRSSFIYAISLFFAYIIKNIFI